MATTTITESRTLSLSSIDSKALDLKDEPQNPEIMLIRQDPFEVTLDSAALVAVSILLVVGMNCVHHLFLEFLILTLPVALLVRNDYRNFLNLGPGGTPATPTGYLKLKWYQLFTLRDPLQPPAKSSSLPALPATGILGNKPLPYRPGPRPITAGLAPHRQLNQHGGSRTADRLRRSLELLAATEPARFVTHISCQEKHGFALFSRQPVNAYGHGEIVHLHKADRSMHLTLHPDDIEEVLKKGWGERHPMTWTGWIYTPVPTTFVMIYAPRDEEDLAVVCKIIEASIWNIAAEKVDIKIVPH